MQACWVDYRAQIARALTYGYIDDGTRIEASKNYKVTGWATVGSVPTGPPIWDVVADYLRRSDTARITKLNTPKLKKTSPAIRVSPESRYSDGVV